MNGIVLVPKPISRTIGSFGLTREVLIQTLLHIHELAMNYDQARRFRTSGYEESQYRDRLVINEGR